MVEVSRRMRRPRGCRTLPVTIYRPSVVVGNSQTGWGAQVSWRVSGPAVDRSRPVEDASMPRDFELDLVPADYVAEAIARLSADAASVGQTFHLTAGEATCFRSMSSLTSSFANALPVVDARSRWWNSAV